MYFEHFDQCQYKIKKFFYDDIFVHHVNHKELLVVCVCMFWRGQTMQKLWALVVATAMVVLKEKGILIIAYITRKMSEVRKRKKSK